MKLRNGWSLAVSAAFHLALFLGLAWSMKPHFTMPREPPMEVKLVRLPVERPAVAAPSPLRPRIQARRAGPAPKETLLVPVQPPDAAAPAVTAPSVSAEAPRPRPIYRGLAGCTDDPGDLSRPPCFYGAVAAAEAPAFVMAGARQRKWDAEIARRKGPAQSPFVACPPDSPQANLDMGCLPR